MWKQLKKKEGFTLIEVVLVIVLIGLIAVIAVPRGLKQASDGAALETESQKLAGAIRMARQKAITYGQVYNVEINANSYNVVESRLNTAVDGRVNLNPNLYGGGNIVQIDQTGTIFPDSTGNIQLTDGTNTKTVQVTSNGTIDIID